MHRFRREDGATLMELAVIGSLLILALSMAAGALTQVVNQEKFATETERAVDEGRTALDDIAREVRQADGLRPGEGGVDAVAWFDADRDGVEQATELVSYDLVSVGEAQELRRITTLGTRVLVSNLRAPSAVTVVPAARGELLRVIFFIDIDARKPPGPTELETEVLARNA